MPSQAINLRGNKNIDPEYATEIMHCVIGIHFLDKII